MENNFGFASSIKASSNFTQPLAPDSKVPWMAVDDAGKFNAGMKLTGLFIDSTILLTDGAFLFVFGDGMDHYYPQ